MKRAFSWDYEKRHEAEAYETKFPAWVSLLISKDKLPRFIVIRQTILLSLTLLSAAAQVPGANQECLKYEPEVVELKGRITRHTFPGPPNYESIEQGDAPETYWILELANPICVRSDDPKEELNEPETDLQRVQLVLRDYDDFKRLVGKQVSVKGSLFHAQTVHHKTPVLIMVSDMRAVPSP